MCCVQADRQQYTRLGHDDGIAPLSWLGPVRRPPSSLHWPASRPSLKAKWAKPSLTSPTHAYATQNLMPAPTTLAHFSSHHHRNERHEER